MSLEYKGMTAKAVQTRVKFTKNNWHLFVLY